MISILDESRTALICDVWLRVVGSIFIPKVIAKDEIILRLVNTCPACMTTLIWYLSYQLVLTLLIMSLLHKQEVLIRICPISDYLRNYILSDDLLYVRGMLTCGEPSGDQYQTSLNSSTLAEKLLDSKEICYC
jgi:hypothetical protein